MEVRSNSFVETKTRIGLSTHLQTHTERVCVCVVCLFVCVRVCCGEAGGVPASFSADQWCETKLTMHNHKITGLSRGSKPAFRVSFRSFSHFTAHCAHLRIFPNSLLADDFPAIALQLLNELVYRLDMTNEMNQKV